MTYYSKVLDIMPRLKNCPEHEMSSVFSEVSCIFPLLNKEQRHTASHDFYHWALTQGKGQSLKYCYARFLMAENSMINEHYDESLQHLAVARSLFEEEHDEKGISLTITLYGAIYRTFGNFELALKTLLEANALLKKLQHDPFYLCATSISMAYIYLDTQSLAYAQEMFTQAYEQCALYNDHYWKSYVLQGLAKVHLIKNEYPEAKACLDESLRWAEEQKNPLAISNTLSELATFNCHISDFKESEKLNLEALHIREQNHFIGASITSCIRLGELYKNTNQPDAAIEILFKGLALAEPLQVKPKIYQIHLLLSEVYQLQNEKDKSYEHFRQFHFIQDQVEREENAQKINNARLVYDAEQTKKENEVIKKQKAEISMKNAELQQTIDELTRTKISRKAKAYTLIIAIGLFIIEDFILHSALLALPNDSYLLSLIVKMGIIFSLNPINKLIEKYLLNQVIKPKVHEIETQPSA